MISRFHELYNVDNLQEHPQGRKERCLGERAYIENGQPLYCAKTSRKAKRCGDIRIYASYTRRKPGRHEIRFPARHREKSTSPFCQETMNFHPIAHQGTSRCNTYSSLPSQNP